jgi:hypothetical protein
MQIANEPQRAFPSHLSDADRPVASTTPIQIEQHSGTGRPTEQVLHLRNTPAHAMPHAFDVDVVTKGDPIEVGDLDDR